MFTHKHYSEIAAILGCANISLEAKLEIGAEFVPFFRSDNPRFNPARFESAIRSAHHESLEFVEQALGGFSLSVFPASHAQEHN